MNESQKKRAKTDPGKVLVVVVVADDEDDSARDGAWEAGKRRRDNTEGSGTRPRSDGARGRDGDLIAVDNRPDSPGSI